MVNRHEEFEKHNFHSSWELVKSELNNVNEKDLIEKEEYKELLRIKKTITFIDSYLKIIEPDLITDFNIELLDSLNNEFQLLKTILNNLFKEYNTKTINETNSKLDSIVITIKSLHTNLPELSSEHISSIVNRYNEFLESILEKVNKIPIEKIYNEILTYKKELFEKDEESIKNQIDTARIDIEAKYKEIIDFYDKTLNEQEQNEVQVAKESRQKIIDFKKNLLDLGEKSISTKIHAAKDDIEDKHNQILEFYNQTLNKDVYDDTLITKIYAAKDDIEDKHNQILEFYNQTLNKDVYDDTLITKIYAAKDDIEETKNNSITSYEQIEQIQNNINLFNDELFLDNEEESIKTAITIAKDDIEDKHNQILEFYNQTLNKDEYDDTLITKVNIAKEEIEKNNEIAKEQLIELQNKINDFKEYYIKVFGELNDEEIRVGGLKKEIEVQKEKLNTFEQEQQDKHNKILEEKIHELNEYENKAKETYDNIHKRIEEHLPGATSAGLAEAYHNERKNFEKPIKDWNKLFITSLGLMFITTLLTFITFSSSEMGWSLSFSHADGIEETMNNMFFKLPLLAPLIWLAIFASKRRSENQRLEQEYAHKEALARSYSSYKQQIEGLNQEDEALLKKLLDSSIETVSKNASDTLDKKHGDGTPSKEVLEKFGEIVKTVTGKK